MKVCKRQIKKQLLRRDSDDESMYELPARQEVGTEVASEADVSYFKLHENGKPFPYPRSAANSEHSYSQQPVQQPPSRQYYPDKIAINGNDYKKVEREPCKEKGQLPKEIQVCCRSCSARQLVPATTPNYYCYECWALNRCETRYKFFRCGECKAKVCYPGGMSQYIKCTKCEMINFVAGA